MLDKRVLCYLFNIICHFNELFYKKRVKIDKMKVCMFFQLFLNKTSLSYVLSKNDSYLRIYTN